jgi:hypothetical protein
MCQDWIQSIVHLQLFAVAATEFENISVTVEFHDNRYINYCIEYRSGNIQQKV